MLNFLQSLNPETIMWTASVELFVVLLVIMQWRGKLPPVTSLEKLADVLNTKGGNILLLWATSMVFFGSTMRFTYWILSKVENGKLDVSNAFALAGFTFISGNAFGGAFSSMLKTMTGESANTNTEVISIKKPSETPQPTKPPTGDQPSPNQAVTAANDALKSE